MKNFYQKIQQNPQLTFILFVQDIWELIKPLFNMSSSHINVGEYYSNYDWVALVIHIIIIGGLYYLFKAYNETKKEIEISKLEIENLKTELSVSIEVAHKRIEQLSKSRLWQVTYFKDSATSNVDYSKDVQSKYNTEIENEKTEFRNYLIDKFPNNSEPKNNELMLKYFK